MAIFTQPQDTVAGEERTLLVTTPDYAEAQQLVDRLSDSGFPVSRLQIVWDGLQRVEHVTGRMTPWRAAGTGAATGAWFGGLIGWLFAVFSPEGLAVFLTYLLVGAIAGALWKGISHASQRGSRDFDTISTMSAREYQVWCDQDLIAQAKQLAGI